MCCSTVGLLTLRIQYDPTIYSTVQWDVTYKIIMILIIASKL